MKEKKKAIQPLTPQQWKQITALGLGIYIASMKYKTLSKKKKDEFFNLLYKFMRDEQP